MSQRPTLASIVQAMMMGEQIDDSALMCALEEVARLRSLDRPTPPPRWIAEVLASHEGESP